ncbi:MAG: hypothetical protein U9P14_11825 [Gemmatimonadota bacterium]|nr:hypothetical protein [Gemmatimonadota bacterium]
MKNTVIVCGVLIVLAALGLTDVVAGGKEPAETGTSLPMGNWGIASRYPGDEGIENDSAVVFTENFEKSTVSDLSQRWTNILNNKFAVLSIVRDTTAPSEGKYCLRMTGTKGSNTGGHLFKLLDEGYEQLYARFYYKFAEDAPYVHHFVSMSGKINSPPYPMGGAGSRPAGDYSFGSAIDLVRRNIYKSSEIIDPPGGWSFYSYWCEMQSWQTPEGVPDGVQPNPYYGNTFSPLEPLQAKRGEWQCVEFMIKLNNPEGRDGEQAFWIDGKLIERYSPGTIEGTWYRDRFRRSGVLNADPQPFEGFRWRTTENLKINIFKLQYYLASVFENDYTPEDPDLPYNDDIARVCFDNVVLATEYIGPISTGETGCDFNNDGRTTVADVIELLLMRRQDPQDLRADYNGDGQAAMSDVIALLIDILIGNC